MKENKKPISTTSSPDNHFYRAAWKAQKKVPWDFLHSYLYARWPYLYIGIGSKNHPIARKLTPIFQAWRRLFPAPIPRQRIPPSTTQASGTVADSYHGKVMPLEDARDLVMVNEPVNLPDLEQVIPYVQARAIIQQNPDHILLVQCPCRFYKEDPCLPIDVCLVIGEPFASLMYQHYPSRAAWITQEQAIEIMEEEDARGHVHHAFFNEVMLGRYYAICNCCSCCCGAMQAHQRGTPMLASSGYLATIDVSECVACGTCEEYCQFEALGVVDGSSRVDEDLCMGCGVCVSKCPENAISLRLDSDRGIPLEIRKLIQDSQKLSV